MAHKATDAMPDIGAYKMEYISDNKRQEFLDYLAAKRSMVEALQTGLYNSGYYDCLNDVINVCNKIFEED